MHTAFKLKFALLLLVLFCSVSVAATQYRIDSWTTENGLPQNSVNNLVQSKDGYIWGVTFGGIFRFDGVRFKVFDQSNTEGLEESRFIGIREDKDGRLWFFSETRSIVKFENGRFMTLTKGKDYHGIPRTYFGGKNQPLIISTEKGQFRYETDKFVKFDVATIKADTAIQHIDKDGGIWLVEEGKNIRRVKDGKVEYFDFPKAEDKKNELNLIYDDRYGNYWLSFPAIGTFRIRNGNVDLVDKEYFTRGFSEDSDGSFWVIKTDKLYKIKPENLDAEKIDLSKVELLSKESGLTGSFIQVLLPDPKSGLWAGTDNGGLLHITPQEFRVFSGKDWGNENEVVYPILEDKNENVWLGLWASNKTSYDTVVKYDGENNFKVYKNNILGAFITAFYEDSNGRIWIGTVGRFGYFENEKFWEVPGIEANNKRRIVHAISQDKNGVLWVATDRGLFKFNQNGSLKFEKVDGLPSEFTTAFLKTKTGDFWVGTKKGLALMKNGELKNFTEQDDLKNDYVRSLYEDADGVIWIGTYDAGLLRYKDGKFKRIAKKDGMFNGNVFCTLEDDNGWFWINSNNGVYRVRKQELNDFADGKIEKIFSIGYNKNDGLLSIEGNGGKQPAGIKRKNGELWFPTQKGVAVINPNDIKMDPTPPPVHIEEIFIDKNEIRNTSDGLEISAEQSNLEINYTGLSFPNTDLVKFRYRLEGLEKDWNDAGTRRTAFYNNIPPGEYTFRVVAANRDGVWNTEGAAIKVVKIPYYYQTWWFLILSVLLIAAIISYIFYNRISALRKIADAKSDYSRRLIESQEAERKRIASELHDGLGQELVVIKNRAMLGITKGDDKKRVAKELGDISESATQALDEVREITNNLRPQLLDRLGLTKALKSMVRKVSNVIDIDSEIDSIDNLFEKNKEINIYRIIQESINNIIKHSEAEKAFVEVVKLENEIILTIKDNGKGFDKHNVKPKGGGLGLVGLEERVNLLGGELLIDSKIGKGTTVEVKFKSSEWRL